ncbi:MAG TPA: ABC transporter ATP-binding protein [Candidatus Dormibacteraeota bacterium]|nr:ABC transporter ATP-binding protein [Candidatus Dormibacteraeota bacterium]
MPELGSAEPLLQVRGLTAGYHAGPVLFGVDMDVAVGELVALIGANGAGKSTLLGVLSGLVPSAGGRVRFAGRDITDAQPDAIVAAGLAHVPQGRRLFATMSVEKNLRLGAYLRRDREVRQDLDRVLDYFPALADKLARDAGTLSGGEQQMVAIGRGLMARPRLLMIDEPSLGLAPKVVERVVDVAAEISRGGIAVLLVEQDVVIALDVARRAYVLENGRFALSGRSEDVERDPAVRRAYLGI